MSDTREYLAVKGWDYREHNGEAVLNCPFCGDTERKFSINLASGLWQCWHANRCGKEGNLYQLKEWLGDRHRRDRPERAYQAPAVAPREYSGKVKAWFEGRGITEATMKAFRIGEVNGKIAFPHYRRDALVNVKLRGIDKKEFSQTAGARQLLYTAGDIDPTRGELYIAEGEIDCMTLHQIGVPNVVALPNGASNFNWIENEYAKIESLARLYLCFDADKAGDDAARAIADRLGPWRCYRVRPPAKDWNELLMAGNLDVEKFIAMKAEATDMAPDELIFPEDIIDELLAPEPEAWRTQHARFDRILGGFRPGEVTLLTGRPGSGKTVFTNDISLNMMYKYPELQVFMASLELRRKTLLKWMLSTSGMIAGKESYEALFKTLNRRLTLYSPADVISIDDLLNAMEYVARRSGIDFVVIDSLMCVTLGRAEDVLDNQRQLMAKLNAFAMAHQCHIIMVAHPRKGSSDDSKISMVDIAGSADLANLAWNVVGMHRGTEDGQLTKECHLRILKNRELGYTGTVNFIHDAQWKRFREQA